MNRLFRTAPSLAFVFALGVAGCRDDNRTVVPNRVLDRPTDMALACLQVDSGRVVTGGDCSAGRRPSCTSDDTPQLVGFVANSERNEIAMWRRCDVNGLVDLDPRAPGYDFVPVGITPSAIAATGDQCRVVTANAGSCDLSALFVPEVGRAALNLEPSMPPGTAVREVVPRTSAGTPLAASPADLIAAPSRLSRAGDDDDLDDPGGVLGCDVNSPASVYVAFPACQLVAEVSLTTQRILQSRRIVVQPDGSVTLEDTGTTPLCPVECPDVAGGANGETVDPDGYFPVTLALAQREDGRSNPDEVDQLVEYDALFVGGTGSDVIVEIPFVKDPDATEREDQDVGLWAPPEETNTLQLEQAFGVQRIRPTPPMTLETGDGGDAQFLYIVAGDGSTRVVSREFSLVDELGTECDTQVEASEAFDAICEPLVPGAPAESTDRRAFANGPGIRLGSGNTVLDWTFQKVTESPDNDSGSSDGPDMGDDMEGDNSAGIVPFDRAGVIGIGVTTNGVIVYVPFDQFAGSTFGGDPLNVMDTTVRPHMLWPILAPSSNDPAALPRLSDGEPTRSGLVDLRDSQLLAPTLRRIDFAYAAPPGDEDPDDPSDQSKISTRLGGIRNADALGAFEPDVEENGALYSTAVPRVVARDYGEWPRGDWSFLWEGDIPGASGSTGQVVCKRDDGGPYCDVGGVAEETGEIDGLSLVDEGASFCVDGVVAGDKVLILGCTDDGDCGLGQVCLRDPTQTIGPGGICVAQGAVADPDDRRRLLSACGAYVTDPCGLPRREYLIREAYQTRLTLWPMEIAPDAFVRNREDVPGLREVDDGPVPGFTVDTCGDPDAGDPTGWCACGAGPEDAPCELEMTLTCRLPDGRAGTEGVCDRDDDCAFEGGDGNYLCIDNLCRRPCIRGVDDNSCFLRSPPPSQACFREFVRYQVRANNSFIVRGPGRASFISDRVVADPDTGRCSIDPDVSNLLTSRIWLGADEAAIEAAIPACPPGRATPLAPNPCRIETNRTDAGTTLFHRMEYFGQPITALRFSNPAISVVLDLTSVLDIARDLPSSDEFWPQNFVSYRRGRIPFGYREAFRVDTNSGYIPIAGGVAVGQQPLVFPVRVMNAPEPGVVYIVDAGGRGGLTGIRGQVMRVNVAVSEPTADPDFRVR